ncbi:DUF262 domain-containing protein [Brevundimonas vesicularis]|uniref:DUF262 domain-containing protein n=1 Tax=Brevundimonas vesicularis TaxID=41276 RepID=UPI00384E2A93
MKAGPIVVGQLLQNRNRYAVPVYQRNYVWTRQKQWEPFWGDIRAKAIERLAGREQRYSHYMGAVVLEARGGFSARRVPTFQVVDGQQRLTTFQLFLSAARDYALAIGHTTAADNIGRYLLNADPRLMEEPEVEVFKVWPTEQNRELFTTIVGKNRAAIRAAYGQHFFVKRDQIYDYKHTPRMIAGYGYFYDRIKEAVERDSLQDELFEPESLDVEGDKEGTADAVPDATEDGGLPREIKLDAIWQALVEEFRVVEIVLEDGDDAQVIFETLNERGEPLLAADLVRNHIYHRAEEREGREKAEAIFKKLWGPFEDPFWGLEEKQGRYKKQRIEFFLGNYIASQTANEITITKLFSEYKAFLKKHPFESVETELAELTRFGAIYRQIVERSPSTALGRFARRLAPWDVTTVFPLVMQIWGRSDVSDDAKTGMLDTLMSFIVRRAVCGLTPKNYNKLFLGAIAALNKSGWSADALRAFFLRQTSESGRWPRDEEFQQHWVRSPMYQQLQPARTRAILEQIETAKRNKFHETTGLKEGLTVEHIMPDQWRSHWPMMAGLQPTTEEFSAAWWAQEGESVVGQIVRRNRLKHSVGNLTLLTQPLNSSSSHAAFTDKKVKLQSPEHGSLLVLTREVTANDIWDEDAIERRSRDLFGVARSIWSIPAAEPTSSTGV